MDEGKSSSPETQSRWMFHFIWSSLNDQTSVYVCVVLVFIGAVKKKSFVEERDRNSGQLRPGIVLAGPDPLTHCQLSLWKRKQTVITSTQHADPLLCAQCPVERLKQNLAVRVIWRLRVHFPPYKVIAQPAFFFFLFFFWAKRQTSGVWCWWRERVTGWVSHSGGIWGFRMRATSCGTCRVWAQSRMREYMQIHELQMSLRIWS